MNWSDVTKPPSTKTLRQFAGLCLLVFGSLAAWRGWHGDTGNLTVALASAALLVGVGGFVAPRLVRPIFTGWMIAAFPIGWAVSRIALGLVFLLVFAPVGLLFRLTGRDVLHLKRGTRESYWVPKAGSRSGEEYLRQF